MEKKLRLLIPTMILLILAFTTRLYAQDVTRGVWMWGSTLSSAGASNIMNKLVSNNVDGVYLCIKGGSGTSTDLSTLNAFISLAHTYNIKVHLWYIVVQDGIFISNHPDACFYHGPKPSLGYNNPYPINDERVNPLYPGYKEFVLDKISDFLNNTDCDGIHLDVIRYSHLVYSFDKYHLQKADSLGCDTTKILQLFRDNYDYYAGSDGFINLYASGDEDVVKWVNMRKEIIYDYIKSIRDLIDQIKPGTELSAAFMPEGAYDPDYSDVHYSQNYSLDSPLFDEICPMAYYNSFGETTSWLGEVTQGAKSKVSSNCKITTGYQTFDGVTATQVKEQIQYSLENGANGVVNFRYGTTSTDQWAVIKMLYREMAVSNAEMLSMCSSVCDYMSSNLAVPDSILVDSTETTMVSAADFYYMMNYYLKYYLINNASPSGGVPIIRDILGPENPGGGQSTDQIQLADILSQAQIAKDYIDSNKVIPDYTTVNSIDYDPPAMFWVYARTINWFGNNGVMPTYATVKICNPPNTWTYGDVTSVEEIYENVIPEKFYLSQNYPNPFNPSTTIEFQLPEAGAVTLKVYDVLGEEIKTLIDQRMNSGNYKVNFDGSGQPSGIYFYNLISGDYKSVKKMILLK